jgi:hypothetical protein
MKKGKDKIDIIDKLNMLENFGYISHDVSNTAKDKISKILEEQRLLKEKLINEIGLENANINLKDFLILSVLNKKLPVQINFH